MLTLAFLPADSELLESHWLNSMASKLAPSGSAVPKIHVELLFPESSNDKDVIGRACSIHYDGEVFLEPKRFSRKQWQFRQVSCTKAQMKKALEFCEAHIGEKFNHFGYFLHPIAPCQITPHTMQRLGLSPAPRWFCTEIVSGALQASGAMSDIPLSCHPEKLFQLVKDLTAPTCPKHSDIKF
ncbi:MAG: hypothetical protein CMO44_16375 [Verrucomicrobiales bacterium]|nr:hypothetical protein [Verrucomicrobiales bacterium]|tara:strand:- start:20 stop:568 length:549 start_codon:yes stop_codon:yes gene_type:complete